MENNRIQNLIKELQKMQKKMRNVIAREQWYRENNVVEDESGIFPLLLTKALNYIRTGYGEKSDFYITFKKMIDKKTLNHDAASNLYIWSDTNIAMTTAINLLKEITDDNLISPAAEAKAGIENKKITDKVFIVHGREAENLKIIEDYITELGFIPIVLYKEVNPGHTVIEKLEKNSDVFAAIILMTPDDKGYLIGEETNCKTRARQNVVFEYGYFIGVIGRTSTIVIDYGVEEKPSDCSGIVLTNNNVSSEMDKVKLQIATGLTKIRNNLIK